MRKAGMKLRCIDGHFEMADWALYEVREPGGSGWWMWTPCDFGGAVSGHWLAPDPQAPGHVIEQPQPYAWPSAVAAFGARDQYAAQEEE